MKQHSNFQLEVFDINAELLKAKRNEWTSECPDEYGGAICVLIGTLATFGVGLWLVRSSNPIAKTAGVISQMLGSFLMMTGTACVEKVSTYDELIKECQIREEKND